jgi:lipopolysaccharide biosynthesis glycosyltransferase
MNTAICTLFEGHYHYGLAALSNSVYKQGFRGTIYVGYRGELPTWVQVKNDSGFQEKKDVELIPAEGLILKFIYLETSNHFTNYKPKFMKDLLVKYKTFDNLFYFDPDIVVNKDFSFYLDWINCGITVCEDVNSPIQEFHPRRVGWRNYFKKYNLNLEFKNQIYVNGGFVGVNRAHLDFLDLWIKTQELAAELIGGLQFSFLDKIKVMMFNVFDQDCLNASIEAYKGTFSFINKEGMGFSVGGDKAMFHALGSPKPWKANILSRAFNGRVPRNVDTAYWANSSGPILAHSKWEIYRKTTSIKLAKLIGRFYKVS